MKTTYEKRYTSTTTKLLHNLDRLQEIQQGNIRPISVQLAPTDKCNLSCDFCSVKHREMKTLTLEQVSQVLKDMRGMGAKTVEFTGGGDPTMYTWINEAVELADQLGYRMGFITNGVQLNKLDLENVAKLTWVRVSLNSLDYVKEVSLNIPEGVTLGFSYVWNARSSTDRLKQIEVYAETYKASYVRIVPDCLNVETIQAYKALLERELVGKYAHMFLQQKEYKVPVRCWMGYLKPFVNSDGFVYHCSANPLIERKFHKDFRICAIADVKEAWSQVTPFVTSSCQEGKCFFAEHNELIEQAILAMDHEDFI